MTNLEKKTAARSATTALLASLIEENAAVQFDNASWAILQTVDGEEIWTDITVKTKAEKFDPFEVAEAWKEETETKAKVKAEKAKAKAEKIARDEARRAEKAKKKEEEEGA